MREPFLSSPRLHHIKAHQNVKFEFEVPASQEVRIRFDSTERANLYFISVDELDDFKRGDRDFGWRRKRRLAEYYKKVKLPFTPGTLWYLIVGNPNDSPITIYRSVKDL